MQWGEMNYNLNGSPSHAMVAREEAGWVVLLLHLQQPCVAVLPSPESSLPVHPIGLRFVEVRCTVLNAMTSSEEARVSRMREQQQATASRGHWQVGCPPPPPPPPPLPLFYSVLEQILDRTGFRGFVDFRTTLSVTSSLN